MSAFEDQVGGEHYRKLKIQPAEYCFANNIGHLAGDAIAYITRYKFKNGLEDLRKAIHSLQLLIEMEELKEKDEIRNQIDKNNAYEIAKQYQYDPLTTKQDPKHHPYPNPFTHTNEEAAAEWDKLIRRNPELKGT